VDQVRAVLVDWVAPQDGAPVHGAHVVVLQHRRMVVDELHLPGDGRPVVMHIKGAHEDSDEHFHFTQVLSHDVGNGECPLVLHRDDRSFGRQMLHVHHSAVRRAHDVFARRNAAGRIPEKPDMTPEQIGQKEEERDEEQRDGQR
jgi:hypothetical protein